MNIQTKDMVSDLESLFYYAQCSDYFKSISYMLESADMQPKNLYISKNEFHLD